MNNQDKLQEQEETVLYPAKFICWCLVLFLVYAGWQAVEINLYGCSQQSIVDAVASLYISWRLTGWATEEYMEGEE